LEYILELKITVSELGVIKALPQLGFAFETVINTFSLFYFYFLEVPTNMSNSFNCDCLVLDNIVEKL